MDNGVIAILGSQGSGKTTTIEYLATHLSEDGLRVGSIKHIHDPNFTIDARGKDTWRHVKAGVKVVASVAEKETAIIKKTGNLKEGFETALNTLKGENLNVILLEGFRSIAAARADIPKVVTADNPKDLAKTLEGLAPPILAVTGIIAEHHVDIPELGIPVINLERNGARLVKLVKEAVGEKHF